MFVATVSHHDINAFCELSQQAEAHADVIEWRLDTLKSVDIPLLQKSRPQKPLIVTIRSIKQGGHWQADATQQGEDLQRFCEMLEAEYLDVEDACIDPIWSWHQNHDIPSQIILSQHVMDHTPSYLAPHLQTLKQRPHHYIKYVTYANSHLDALRMMAHSIQHPNTSAFCMGPLGVCTRRLGPMLHNPLNYYSADEQPAAPGQTPIQQRNTNINVDTQLYALLGNPVEQSLGDHFHNHVFKHQDNNAWYEKFNISQLEVGEATEALRQLPIRGLSITTPLKNDCIPWLHTADALTQQAQSCNTIRIDHQTWIGSNTDGPAAVDCLRTWQHPIVRPCHVLGIGPTARAIACAIAQQSWPVTLYGRNRKKRQHWQQQTGIRCQSLRDFHSLPENSIVINTIPGQSQNFPSYLSTHLQSCMVLLDCCYQPTPSPLTPIATAMKCHVVSGDILFRIQAQMQQGVWGDRETVGASVC